MTSKRADLLPSLALLGVLLVAAWLLHAWNLLYVVGGTGTLVGWRFGFVLALFYAAAVAVSAVPGRRLPLLLAASLLQIVVLHGPLRAVGALVIWAGFYALVEWRISWWIRGPIVAALYAAPFVIQAADPDSALLGILLVAFFGSGFVLRSAIYAYEGTMKRPALEGAGFSGYLLYLIAAPLGAVKLAPIGFAVLHRGLRRETDPALLRRGTGEIALGFTYLVLMDLGNKSGLLPTFADALGHADGLDAPGAFAVCHMILLRLFLDVAGHVHLAVGMMRVLGFDIPAGTEAPYLSRNILDFWRRWNTYYRDYLMTLAYYPVAVRLKRRPFVAVAVAGTLTFLLSGFAHAVQMFVRRPDRLSLERFLEMHVWALVYGLLVVIWMMREAARTRRRGAKGPKGAPDGPWPRARRVGSIGLTMTALSLILLLLYPPLSNLPLASSLRILAAFLRVPAWLE